MDDSERNYRMEGFLPEGGETKRSREGWYIYVDIHSNSEDDRNYLEFFLWEIGLYDLIID